MNSSNFATTQNKETQYSDSKALKASEFKHNFKYIDKNI